MWQVSRAPRALTGIGLVAGIFGSPAVQAQTNGYPYGYQPSFQNSQSVQYGLNLPQIPVPNGSDEIRAADGTSCKSSMAGNGPSMDVGLLGNQDFMGQFSSGTVYGRVVFPLGPQPKRLDCTKLYQLEITRLQHELELVRMGMNGRGAGVLEGGSTKDSSWQTRGWKNSPTAAVKTDAPNKLGAVPQQNSQPGGATVRKPATIVATASTLQPATVTKRTTPPVPTAETPKLEEATATKPETALEPVAVAPDLLPSRLSSFAVLVATNWGRDAFNGNNAP